MRRRPQHRHHVWSYDFVMDRTHDGRAFRMLTVIDEYSRECLAIRTERRQNQETVLETLVDLFLLHGPPDYIRSDNGAEFTAIAVRDWLYRLDVQTLFIEPGSPWENGYMEPNDLGRNNYYNVTAEPNDEGSITIHLGSCELRRCKAPRVTGKLSILSRSWPEGIKPVKSFAFSVPLVMLFLQCALNAPAFAQARVSVGGVELDSEAGVSGVLGDVDDNLEKTVDEDGDGKQRSWEPVVAPLPSRNPVFGWMISVPAMLMYKPSFAVPEDSVWISGLFGFYAENESWGAGLLQRMSFGGDRWRVMGALFHAEMNYDYFGIGGGGGASIVLDQDMDLVLAEGLRRIAPNLYLGLRATYAETELGPQLPDITLPPGFDPDLLRVDLTLATIAPRLQYDTRDNEFYPRSGFLIDATAAVSRDAIGADVDYERYDASMNHYLPIGNNGVVASRIASQYTSQDTPFFLYPAFGQGADLRGYQMGSYRDRFLVAAQAEYRHRFTKRIGAAAFGGMGSVAPDFAGWEKTLWSVGTGFRFVLAPKNDISLRLDIARGRDETVYYVGIGEAF